MTDAYIVEMYWERNEQAVTATSEKYGTYCYTVAYGILHNVEDSKESVNDTYMSAWNSMPPHKPAILKTFLGKITRRLSIDRYWTSYRNVFLRAVIQLLNWKKKCLIKLSTLLSKS